MIAHIGAGYRNGNDVPVPPLINVPSSWMPSGRIAEGLEGGRDTFVFLMAASSRNKIRREIKRQLLEARKLKGERQWVSSTGVSRIEFIDANGKGGNSFLTGADTR